MKYVYINFLGKRECWFSQRDIELYLIGECDQDIFEYLDEHYPVVRYVKFENGRQLKRNCTKLWKKEKIMTEKEKLTSFIYKASSENFTKMLLRAQRADSCAEVEDIANYGSFNELIENSSLRELARLAAYYASYVMKARWPEAEPLITIGAAEEPFCAEYNTKFSKPPVILNLSKEEEGTHIYLKEHFDEKIQLCINKDGGMVNTILSIDRKTGEIYLYTGIAKRFGLDLDKDKRVKMEKRD